MQTRRIARLSDLADKARTITFRNWRHGGDSLEVSIAFDRWERLAKERDRVESLHMETLDRIADIATEYERRAGTLNSPCGQSRFAN